MSLSLDNGLLSRTESSLRAEGDRERRSNLEARRGSGSFWSKRDRLAVLRSESSIVGDWIDGNHVGSRCCSGRKVAVRSGLGLEGWKAGIFFVQGSAWWRKPQLASSRTTPPVRQDKEYSKDLLHPGLTHSLIHSSYRDVGDRPGSGVSDVPFISTGLGVVIYRVCRVYYGRSLLSSDVLQPRNQRSNPLLVNTEISRVCSNLIFLSCRFLFWTLERSLRSVKTQTPHTLQWPERVRELLLPPKAVPRTVQQPGSSSKLRQRREARLTPRPNIKGQRRRSARTLPSRPTTILSLQSRKRPKNSSLFHV